MLQNSTILYYMVKGLFRDAAAWVSTTIERFVEYGRVSHYPLRREIPRQVSRLIVLHSVLQYRGITTTSIN